LGVDELGEAGHGGVVARVDLERHCPRARPKAGKEHDRFRSYGSTTADGILALLASGHAATGDRGIAAQHWLVSRHRDLDVPGFTGGPAYRRWPKGLAYYYAATSTRAFHELGIDPGAVVADTLANTQRADGSWANAENVVKEDDPLIATPFAVRALAAGVRR
jgi:hypothetical protein